MMLVITISPQSRALVTQLTTIEPLDHGRLGVQLSKALDITPLGVNVLHSHFAKAKDALFSLFCLGSIFPFLDAVDRNAQERGDPRVINVTLS